MSTIIEFYIKEAIKNHFKDSQSTLTIILRTKDNTIIGKAIITKNKMLFCGYEYSRNRDEVQWQVREMKMSYSDFKHSCEFAHEIEFS